MRTVGYRGVEKSAPTPTKVEEPKVEVVEEKKAAAKKSTKK
jgi:hypothetical protein